MNTTTEEKMFIDMRAERAAKQSSLLDNIMKDANIKNDAHLSRLTEVSPPVISKLRNGWLPMGPSMLISLNEVSGRSIRDMKAHLGMKVLDRHPNVGEPLYHPV